MVISPFVRKHYVSHIPMDHTQIIKFVESRLISASAHLTNHDLSQPNLLDFFDFTNVPWATPPMSPLPASLRDHAPRKVCERRVFAVLWILGIDRETTSHIAGSIEVCDRAHVGSGS